MSEDYYTHRHSSSRFLITAVDDTGDAQVVSLSGYDNEAFTQVMRHQPHGLASNPPLNSHGLGVSPGGARDRLYFHGGEDPNTRQKNLPSGTAVLYDDQGNVIRAYGSAGIQISAAKGNVYVQPQSGKFVFLGGNGTDGNYDFVMTLSGPSTVVKAKL